MSIISLVLAVINLLIIIAFIMENSRLRQENEDLREFIPLHTTVLFDVIDEVVKHCFNKVTEKGKKK